MNWRKLLRGVVLGVVLGAAGIVPAPLAQGAASAAAGVAVAKPAAKIKNGAIPNLGQMAPNLYRGGQPEEAGFAELKKLGIEIVVNFRETEKAEKEERARVEALGIRYVEIPWSGFDDPAHKDVAQFLQVLKENPGKKVFFHCRRGAERTGVMGATYRMAFEGWTAEQALHEMEQFKFRGFWFRHLKRYVRSFPEQFKTDSAFAPLRP
jgi:protein tyrosine phosphatase (PTP) superfamily phosphohydrolase (DUF442 family)